MTTSAPATGRELHIDVPLSNVVVGRRPEGFIADQLLPITPVDKQSNTYFKFRPREWYRHEANLTARAPGTEPRKVGFTVTSDQYFCKNYALGAEWPVEDAVNHDAVLQWAESNATFVTDRLMMDYEMRVAALAVTSSNVATIAMVNSQWSDPAVALALNDLQDQIDGFRRLTGLRPNTMIVPEQVMSLLRRNTQLRDIIFGQNNGGLVQESQLAQILRIEKVLVPMSLVNTAGETATTLGSGTLSDVWGKNVWLAKINNLSGMMTDTWLNAFRWTSPLFNQPMAVVRYPFDVKRKVFGIEVSYYQDEKVVSPDLAIRVSSVIA